MPNEPENKFSPSDRRRPRRLEEASTAEIDFPLVWIIIGGLAGLIVIGLIGLGVVNLVRKGAITPTPQALAPLVETVQSTPAITSTAVVMQPAPIQPTATPAGQPAAAETVAPAPADTPAAEAPASTGKLEINGYAKVTGTDGLGLSLRAGPGRNNARLSLAEENDSTRLLLLDGPRADENGEDYVWWFVRHPDGSEGWAVEDYLLPADAP